VPCVAACCSVLQCVAVCCSVSLYVAMRCDAYACNALQCVALCCPNTPHHIEHVLYAYTYTYEGRVLLCAADN